MRVIVGCEFSGVVRDAFRARGHEAYSCDLLPTEADPRWHLQGDVFTAIRWGRWDLGIFHPSCTYLTNSANKHLYVGGRKTNGPDLQRWAKLRKAARFFRRLLDCDIERVVVENPVMTGAARKIVGRGPDQIIQPWMFGHPETKATGLWLRNVPELVETDNVRGEMERMSDKDRHRVHWASPGPERWKDRSRTLRGVGAAMAQQWGAL